VEKTIESMCKDEVFQVFDREEVGLTQKQRDLGRRDFDIYLFMIWPFIEGYWLAACSLLLLVVPTKENGPRHVQWFAAKEFEKRAQVREREGTADESTYCQRAESSPSLSLDAALWKDVVCPG
jgi:hypothetical protein